MRTCSLGLVAALVLAACGASPQAPAVLRGGAPAVAARAGGKVVETRIGPRTFSLFVPAGLAPGQPAPLVVMLHGCRQDPDSFAMGTRMNALAARERFYVLYPEQPRLANAYKCWNWFLPGNQVRGAGEPAAIAEAVGLVRQRWAIQPEAIFCAGLSAGGAMASILGATYPDVFCAIAVASGLEYQAARSVAGAKAAMKAGGPPPVQVGQAAFAAMQASRVRRVPTFVVHGDGDAAVAPLNAEQVLAQWAVTNDMALDGKLDGDVDTVPDAVEEAQTPGGRRYTRARYEDAEGRVTLERVIVHGMGHAWSGGDPAGSYTDPAGPDASAMIWQFFQSHRRPARQDGAATGENPS
jgi:poly(hydroxyalkanoate) depolymerase family esterase